MSDKSWTGKTGGTHWMQLTLIRIFQLVGVGWMYPLMYIWIVGYVLCVGDARRSIYYYWHQRQGKNGIQSAWHLWLTYVAFGKAILDRFAAWAGHRVHTTIEGLDELNQMLNLNLGCMAISSHIGNQELAGYNFTMPRPMYALIYMGDTETVNSNRSTLFEQMGIHTIPYRHDGGHVIDIHNAISDRNIVSIHGDRMLNGVRQIRQTILGEVASFPEGPFRIAASEAIPVVTLFMMRERYNQYRLIFKVLSDGQYTSHNRKEQEQQILQAYTNSIEHIIAQYPHQWFHFHHFWEQVS